MMNLYIIRYMSTILKYLLTAVFSFVFSFIVNCTLAGCAMAKRPSVAEGPPAKKVHFEPVQLGAVSTLEEMDMRTLHFQNRKLAQRYDRIN